MKIAIHVHVYYQEMWTQIQSCLNNIDIPYDLFVSMVQENKELESEIKAFCPTAVVEVVENKGFDVGPFIMYLNGLNLDEYDYFIKLHTKRNIPGTHIINLMDVDGTKWRDALYRFCSTPENWKKTKEIFANESKVGMVADACVVIRWNFIKRFRKDINEIMNRMGLTVNKTSYVAGTMFIMRAKLLKVMQGQFTFPDDFGESGHGEGKSILPFLIEGALGYIVTAQGYKIKGLNSFKCAIRQVAETIGRFFYYKKAKPNKTIIKICKIPVFIKKEKHQKTGV